MGDKTGHKRKTSPERRTQRSRQGGPIKKALRTPTLNRLKKNPTLAPQVLRQAMAQDWFHLSLEMDRGSDTNGGKTLAALASWAR